MTKLFKILNAIFGTAITAAKWALGLLLYRLPVLVETFKGAWERFPGVPFWPVLKIILILAFVLGSFVAGHRVGREPLPRVAEKVVAQERSLAEANQRIATLEQQLKSKPKDVLPVTAACPPAPKKEPTRKVVRQARPAAAKKVTTNQSSVFPF